MSRADASETRLARLPNFYLYVDEFQSFANESFADILSEARKYKLNLTVAHQYIEQMSEEVRAAIFGNVGTMVVFRVGPFDADIFEKEFMPTFIAEDFVNLGFAQVYLKLMIDGVGSQPFSALTMPPIGKPPISYKQQVLLSSQEQFGGPRIAVEEEIAKQMLGEKGAEATPSRETPQNENKRGEPSRPRQSRERDMRPRAPENVEKIERVERRETVPVRSEVKEETKIETREVRHQAVRIESGVKEVLKQAGTEEHLTSLRSTLASVIGAVDPIVSKEKEVPVHLVLSKEVPKVVLERPVQESRKREEPNLYSKRSQNQGQNMEALRAVLQKLKNEESKEGIKDEAKEEPRIEEKVIVVKSDEVAKEEVVTSEKKKDFKPVEIPEDELRALLHVDRDNA